MPKLNGLALWSLAAFCLFSAGCLPRLIVNKNPGARDKGIRYYRPKPYLLITPVDNDADHVSISLDWLPDFSEEYSLNVRTGFGTAEVNIQLEDGWNLTKVDQNLDSKTAENIEAVSKLLAAIPKFPGSGGDSVVRGVEVPASNVPLGYYESIIGKDRCGNKQLFGFRYIGFLPFQACPVDICGSSSLPCDDGLLYGLCFEDRKMCFKPICEIGAVLRPSQKMDAATASGDSVPMTRTLQRSFTFKDDVLEEKKVIIQDNAALPIIAKSSEFDAGSAAPLGGTHGR